MTSAARPGLPELLLGLGIVALGVVIGVEAAGLKAAPAYARVGPALFMWITASLLIACGGWIGWQAWRRAAPEDVHHQYGGPALILGGLLLQTVSLERLGFVPSAALLFIMTAAGLGSRKLPRDAVAGLVLAVLAFVAFRYGLGLRLPVGSFFG